MKTFRQLVSEVAQPRGGDERRFKDLHVDGTNKVDYVIPGQDHVFTGSIQQNATHAGEGSDEKYDTSYVDNGNEGEVDTDYEDDEGQPAAAVERVKKLQRMRAYNESVELVEVFKAGTIKLKDGGSQKITKEEAKALNVLFAELSGSNKTRMQERMVSSQKGYKEIVQFAKTI